MSRVVCWKSVARVLPSSPAIFVVLACENAADGPGPGGKGGSLPVESGGSSDQAGVESGAGGSRGNAGGSGGTAADANAGGNSVNGSAGRGAATNSESGAGGALTEPTFTSGSGGESNPGMHCAPGEPFQVYPYGTVQPCQGEYALDHHLPSASNSTVRNIQLETPTRAGERFAFSVESEGRFTPVAPEREGEWPYFIEVWGANELCGVGEQLLWWGPERNGVVCGEFTPNAAYSHLLHVRRQRFDTSFGVFSNTHMTLCNAGSCPAGAEGEGLAPGGTLNPPLVFEGSTHQAVGRSYELWFGKGRMLLLLDQNKQPKGTPNPVSKGFFRMSPDDRFGDAWYCIGENSSVTENEEGTNHVVSLQNITRLPSCDTLGGSGTASFIFSDTSFEFSSSFADLPSTALLGAPEKSCTGTFCEFRFTASTTTIFQDRRLYLDLAESVGSYFDPITTPTAITRAFLFHEPDANAPIHGTCTGSGTLSYDPEATTTLTLDAMSEYFTCPGEPIDGDTFDFEFGAF